MRIFLALLLVCVTRLAAASCTCGGEEVEIAFILDCSGSTSHTLNTLQEQIRTVMDVMQANAKNAKVGIVVYRTKEYVGKFNALDVMPFTPDRKKVTEYLRTQPADGGGEEIIDQALDATLDKLSWTQGARKLAIMMGDEQGSEEMQARCMERAKKFKQRGISLNTVTASDTAWIYYVAPGTWKQQMAGMPELSKRTFKLPYYMELAEAGGGESYSSWNARELILRLMGVGLGLSQAETEKKIDVNAMLAWSRDREKETAPGTLKLEGKRAAKPLVAWVRHGGDWQAPHKFESVMSQLNAQLVLQGPLTPRVLALTDEDLNEYPVLYVTGHGAISWNDKERLALKRHLENGGTLIADACCGDAAFAQSLQVIARELFPDAALEKLDPAHPIFSSGFRLNQLQRAAVRQTGDFRAQTPDLRGLFLPGERGEKRLALVFSPYDLGCSWQPLPMGKPCQHEDGDGMKLSLNILLYALTR